MQRVDGKDSYQEKQKKNWEHRSRSEIVPFWVNSKGLINPLRPQHEKSQKKKGPPFKDTQGLERASGKVGEPASDRAFTECSVQALEASGDVRQAKNRRGAKDKTRTSHVRVFKKCLKPTSDRRILGRRILNRDRWCAETAQNGATKKGGTEEFGGTNAGAFEHSPLGSIFTNWEQLRGPAHDEKDAAMKSRARPSQ